ncbi:MAG: HPF/RaiA family ribosome-associated protein [Deltaproteobacteria bacterium]|nr:HPF/RaiA family ribosome-associated protein [Deltaproteobacteria bacterium]
MELPVQVTFRHLDYSSAIARAVRKRAALLDKFYGRITACRVMIEPSTRRQRQGNLWHIRVGITVPGAELIVRRSPPKRQADEDIYVAIGEAFDAARRELEDYVRLNFRGRQRSRQIPTIGRVIRLFPNEDCGFLESSSSDHEEIYFHRNSVLNHNFDRLEVGSKVQYAQEQGEKGPQASTVKLVRKKRRPPHPQAA